MPANRAENLIFAIRPDSEILIFSCNFIELFADQEGPIFPYGF